MIFHILQETKHLWKEPIWEGEISKFDSCNMSFIAKAFVYLRYLQQKHNSSLHEESNPQEPERK